MNIYHQEKAAAKDLVELFLIQKEQKHLKVILKFQWVNQHKTMTPEYGLGIMSSLFTKQIKSEWDILSNAKCNDWYNSNT